MEYLVEKQHKQGKLHAIERINRLVDNGSFHEIGQAVINYRSSVFNCWSASNILCSGREVFLTYVRTFSKLTITET